MSVKGCLSWVLLVLLVIATAGVLLQRSYRARLGENIVYSMEDEYRHVDRALIRYVEIEPLVPTIGSPSALAVAPDGKIYVGGRNEIEVFPKLKPESGEKGSAKAEQQPVAAEKFDVEGKPSCIAVDDDGVVFVGFQDHLVSFSPERKFALSLSPGNKAYLTSIAVDDDFIYVADAGNRSVWRYDKTGGNPMEIGAKNEADGIRGFYVPSPYFDLDLGTDGSLWVVNPGYHAFENYSPGGRLISTWEKAGFRIEAFSGCCNPAHFALMPDGSFVTAEKGLPRVKIHNLDGSLRCVVAAPDQFDNDADGLDVAVDQQGRVYVLDPGRGKVRVFNRIFKKKKR